MTNSVERHADDSYYWCAVLGVRRVDHIQTMLDWLDQSAVDAVVMYDVAWVSRNRAPHDVVKFDEFIGFTRKSDAALFKLTWQGEFSIEFVAEPTNSAQ